jgi:Rrf2 family protein
MLSKKCQYALHALTYLSSTDGSRPRTIREIATGKNIPEKFLGMILLELTNAGMLHSKKGKGGGYTLARTPAQITVLEVVSVIDGTDMPCVSSLTKVPCTLCPNPSQCSFNRLFGNVRREILKVLNSYSVVDLLSSPIHEGIPQALINEK